MVLKRSRNSRFYNTPLVLYNGIETLHKWVEPSWIRNKPADEFIGTFTVDGSTEGRPDLISSVIYNTPLLDWVIISFNATHYPESNAKSVLNWPISGTVVRYPIEIVVLPTLG